MRQICKFTLSVLIFTFSAFTVFGQATGGAITGSISDANAAALPNVTVKLTDKVRGNSMTVQTTGGGAYTFPNVPVGDYTITAELSSFATGSKDVRVALNQTTTVDFVLNPAGVTGVVDVVADTDTIVQSDTSQLSATFEKRKVEDLPLLNGDVNGLAQLAPNVLPRATGVVGGGTVTVGSTVGGVRPRGNSFTIDGIDNNDAGVTGPSVTGVIQDAVEEFTLLQNNYNAEFGSGSGGQFNTITKSGTNQFHGRAFTYINSQHLNARTTLEDLQDEKNFFKRARYGGTFGGPIIKNKLFFFGAYERFFEEVPGAPPTTYLAPTAAGLDQIAALPGASPFIVNLMRENLLLPTTQDSTFTVLGTPIPFGSVTLAVPGSTSGHSFQINVDHIPNASNQIRYRFGYDRQRIIQAGGGGTQFNNFVALDSRLFSATWIRTINSNLVNDLRFSYRRAIDDRPLVDPAVTDFPNITVNDLNLAWGPDPNLPQGTPVDNNYQLYDAMTIIQGNHAIKVGGEFRNLIYTSSFLPRARGDYFYSFDRLVQDLAPLEGDAIRGVGSPGFTGNRNQWFVFGQDDWKVRPNITLNLGLRYEYSSLPRDAASQALNNIASVPGVIEFNVPKTDKNNFAPRLGFAWSPNFNGGFGKFLFGEQGDSAIRANFAISHFVNFQNLLLLNLPPQFAQEIVGGGSDTAFLQSGAIPNILQPATTPEEARASTSSFIVDQKTPQTASWTLSYQRQLTRDMGLELRYLSTRSKYLPIQVQLNAAEVQQNALIVPTFFSTPTAADLAGLPTIGDIAAANPNLGVRALTQYGFGENQTVTAFSPVGKSSYDSFAASLMRRFSKGLGLTAAYTWSKTIDDATNELNTSALNPRRPQDGFNIADEKGLSALDVPHRFVTSVIYDITFFKDIENPVLDKLLNGWQINGIFQVQSGQAITIRSGIDSNVNLDAAGDRAIFNPNGDPNIGSTVTPIDANGNEVEMGDDDTVAYVANTPNAGFVQTGILARSNLGRNTFRTKGFNTTDLMLLKNTYFGRDGRYNFQIGAEFLDVFNQRPKTVASVGAQTAAFAIAGNPNFLNYGLGDSRGRFVTMRAKFIF